MGMEAIWVMWPGPFEETFVSPSQGGFIWNLASIGSVVSSEMFENIDIHTTHIRTTEAYLYYKLTNEPKRFRWAKNKVVVKDQGHKHLFSIKVPNMNTVAPDV